MRSLGGRVGGGSLSARAAPPAAVAVVVGSSKSEEREEADEEDEEGDGEREGCIEERGLLGADFRRVGALRPTGV